MSDTKFLAIAIVIAAVLISGTVLFVAFRQQGAPLPGASPVASPLSRASVALGAQTLGDKNAKVKIVEFGDFQCPICKMYHEQLEPQIISTYVNTGKAVFSWRDFIVIDSFLHPEGNESKAAAQAARCAADQGKFWPYHDLLFSKQGAENSNTFTTSSLETWAGTLGLNAATFKQCLESQKYLSAVKDDMQAGITAGVDGTPTMYINGIKVVGVVPFDTVKQIVDSELAK